MPPLLPKCREGFSASMSEEECCHDRGKIQYCLDTENGFKTSISEEGGVDLTGTRQLMKQCYQVTDKGFNASVSEAALP